MGLVHRKILFNIRALALVIAILYPFAKSFTQDVRLLINKGQLGTIRMAGSSVKNNYLYTYGTDDKQLVLWDMEKNLQIHSWIIEEEITSIDISELDKKVVCVTVSGAIYLMDICSFAIEKIIEAGYPVKIIRISPDGKYILTTGNDSTVIIWDVMSKSEKKRLEGFAANISGMIFSPDKKWFFTCDESHIINVFNSDFEFFTNFATQEESISCLTISQDSKLLLAGFNKGNITTFDISNLDDPDLTSIFYLEYNEHTGTIQGITPLPDNSGFISLGRDGVYKIWENISKTSSASLYTSNQTDYTRLHVTVNSTGTIMAVVSSVNEVQYRTFLQDKLIDTYQTIVAQPISLAFIPGEYGFFGGYTDNQIRMFDPSALNFNNLKLHSGRVQKISISPDKKYIASIGWDKRIVIADLQGQIIKKYKSHGWISKAIEFCNADTSLFIVDSSYRIIKIKCNESFSENIMDLSYSLLDPLLLPGDSGKSVYSVITYAEKYHLNNGKPESKFYPHSIGFPDQVVDAILDNDMEHIYLAYKKNGIVGYDMRIKKETNLYGKHENKITSLALAIYSPILLAGSKNGTIYFFNTGTNQATDSLKAHEGEIFDMDISYDDRFFITAGADGEIKMWDLMSHQLLACFIGFYDSPNYLVYTPENYYSCSRYALSNIGFYENGETHFFNEYDVIYNRPDKVVKKTGCSDAATIEILEKAVNKRMANMPMPRISNYTDSLPVITIRNKKEVEMLFNPEEITLDLEIRNPHSSSFTLNIYRNNIVLYGKKGLLINNKKETISQKINIPMISGYNRIEIGGINSNNLLSNSEIMVNYYVPVTPKPRTLYIIAMGASEYADETMNLTYASKDATDFLTSFSENYRFGEVKKFLLVNKDVTIENLLKLRNELKKSQPDDMVMIFYAGHGIIDDKKDYYLASYTIDFGNPSNGGINYNLLEQLVDGIPANTRTIFIDACYSGLIDKEDAFVSEVEDDRSGKVTYRGAKIVAVGSNTTLTSAISFKLMCELFNDFSRSTGAYVFSSAGGYECAYESPEWKNGVFTYSLIHGIQSHEADLDKDGYVYTNELLDYVQKEVERLTKSRQRPLSRSNSNEFQNLIYKYY